MTKATDTLRELLAKAKWADGWEHNIVPPGKPAHELACKAIRALPDLLDTIDRLQSALEAIKEMVVPNPEPSAAKEFRCLAIEMQGIARQALERSKRI